MDRRARVALIGAGLSALAAAAAAQNPPAAAPPARADTAQRDTLAPRLLYDETFAPGSAIVPRIVLDAHMVYRIVTQPGQAVNVSYSRRPTLPPLFMVPLEGGPPEASGEASFLVVPQSTDEYRIDITYTTNQPVRLEIWTDPKEMSRMARVRALSAGQPAAGFGLRAVYFGPFVRPGPEFNAATAQRGTASAAGIEACLGVIPRGEWISGPVGGCVLAVARLFRPDTAGGMWLLSTEPRWELSPPRAAVEQSVVVTVGIGTTVSHGSGDYFELGLGYDVATRALGRGLYVEAEAGLARMQQLGGGLETIGKASIVPHLSAGLQLRF